MFEQGIGPVVDDPSHECLDVAELGVDTEHEQHDEENDCPEDGSGQTENEIGIREEHQAGAGVDHVMDRGLLDVRHVAEDREDQHPGDQTRRGVDNASDDSVPGIRKMIMSNVVRCKSFLVRQQALHRRGKNLNFHA